ncbi:ABC transporter permease [Cryptosporangium sp. NPDC051539]|uniref:ABC transporter permease n=1 Tax=Cryptosporangium sp. NPDC051539 TaxID=3363962 RepID=UPI0037AB19A0
MSLATREKSARRKPSVAAVVGVIALAMSLCTALLGPLVRPYAPNALVGAPRLAPSGAHPLGTDDLGRDLFSRILSGGLDVVVVPLLATVVAFVLGTALGMASGYVQGRFDVVVSRSVDVLISLPPLLLAIVFISGFGSSLHVLVLVTAAFFIPRITRIVRGVTVPVVANDFVSASRLRGLSTSATLWRDVVPNISGVLIVEFAARLGNVIMFVATLNFLGLGTQPPAASWGLMVSETLSLLRTNPAAPLTAAALIAALAVGVSLLADELAAYLAKDQLGGRR